MKAEWKKTSDGEIFGIDIWGEDKEYPLAIIIYGNEGTCDKCFVWIQAVSGILKHPRKTCYECTRRGSHGLERGPVDEKLFYKPIILKGHDGVVSPKFSLKEMREIATKELGADPGPAPK